MVAIESIAEIDGMQTTGIVLDPRGYRSDGVKPPSGSSFGAIGEGVGGRDRMQNDCKYRW